MRVGTAAIGAATLFAIALMSKRSLFTARGKTWLHIIVASVLNIVGFSLFTAFAQLTAATSRVTILTYTMPIWAVLLARIVLGEKLTVNRTISVILCICGLLVLIYPLAESGVPSGILLAIGAGVSWAVGTIYQKWARIKGDPVVIAAWQVGIAFVIMIVCVHVSEGDRIGDIGGDGAGRGGSGAVGSGVAYLLWFEIVRRLSAMTASLGILSSPVIGVLSSVVILGERPTLADVIGFMMIFAASVCVLIQPRQVIPAS
jgi:drug/metabolite transporter (DMT)-like permease